MFLSYLKIAARHLWKNKLYTFINIAGLGIGLACALFILIWVQDELSYDRFHENLDTLFRLEQDQNYSGDIYHVNVTPHPVGPGIVDEFPEVVNACRMNYMGKLPIRFGDSHFQASARLVDPSFFQLFTFPLKQGDPAAVLDDPHSAVITEKLADTYFKDVSPIGQTIRVSNRLDFQITGVMADLPSHSSIQGEMFLPFELTRELGYYNESWGSNSIITFLQTVENPNTAELDQKITELINERKGGDSTTTYMLAPLERLHLHSHFGFGNDPGMVLYVYVFSLIGLFVLLIASINFMNLATARSVKRALEIGIRKVLGATREKLAFQFLGEALLTTAAALIFALLLLELLKSPFQMVTGKSISIGLLLNFRFISGLLVITLITGLSAGSFPSFYLSALQPIIVLKGGLGSGSGKILLRKILVIFQFTLSVFLIIGTIIVYQQLDFMRSKSMGYDHENLIYLTLYETENNEFDLLKKALITDTHVVGVTGSNHPPTNIGSNSGGSDWPGKDPEKHVLIGMNAVDHDFTDVMGIQILAGRGFHPSFGTDLSTDSTANFLVNEEVVKLIGHENVIGMQFDFVGVTGQIVGVMKNFHFKPVDTVIEPLAIYVDPPQLNFMEIRLASGDLSESLEAVSDIWKQLQPGLPFDPHFIDEELEGRYEAEQDLGILIAWFAAVALLIACLGLIGLATFSAQQRMREIGIRKVLGAGVPAIVTMLCTEFMWLILAANLIAWLPAYIVLNSWLQDYGYHINLGVFPFIMAIASSILITLLTVGVQAARTALLNPSTTLHYQ